jgi:hypothetical protein
VIDLTHALTAWLRSTDARTLMKEIAAEAVQSEIRSALEDELIDVEAAATMLAMTDGALRKAVRGVSLSSVVPVEPPFAEVTRPSEKMWTFRTS